MLRSHTCGELRAEHIGTKSTLCGWVQSRRDHGGVIFIDLRDRFGLTQVVFDPSHNPTTHKSAEHIGREWVLKVEGKVRARKEGMENPKLPTGKVELISDHLEILAKSDTPPIEIEDDAIANEELRLKYRYLDLRRPIMQKRLEIRHRATQAARNFLSKNGFLEIETPMLIRSTPEGARDYVVPSRVTHGSFYSLPQSPQLYKQILMVAGMDRYFQIARCLRDEDLRADRQPEFTQIDLEMSYATEEDIYGITEGMVKDMFHQGINHNIEIPFPRITYDEAIRRYGSDKPDLRYKLELVEVSDIVAKSEFGVFTSIVQNKGHVVCINVPGGAKYSRNEIDSLIEYSKEIGAKGLAWMKVTDKGLDSNIAKYFQANIQDQLKEKMDANPDDLLLFMADKGIKAFTYHGSVRKHLAEKMGLITKEFKFLWVTDFPLFEYNEEEQRIEPAHHMFTMPKEEDIHFLKTDPLKIRARCYDLVLNGTECASGSIRNHKLELQKEVMGIIGISNKDAQQRFGFLLDAFKFGAPPHGGIAPGLDRLVALMVGFNDIREVMAFPKNKRAENPMDGCPSPIDDKTLKDLGLKLDFVKK